MANRGKQRLRRPPADGYFALVQVANDLGVARETVVRWNRLRRGPPVTQINGLKLYRQASVDAWLARHERDPEAEAGRRRRRA